MSFPTLELQLPSEFLADFLAAAKHAKDRIWLQTMNYDPSPETAEIEKVLIKKALAGIDVRLNIDWVSERFYDHSFDSFPHFHLLTANQRQTFRASRQDSLDRLIAAGAKIVITNKPPYLKSFFPIIGRNHIKMYLVDEVVWMGGVNLVLDGFNNIDGMVKTTHPTFLSAMTEQYFKVNQQRSSKSYAVPLDKDLELIVDNGRVNSSLIYDRANQAIASAKSEIQLYSQIMPTGKLFRKLLAKSAAGVPVTFITSPENDQVFVHFPEVLFYQNFRQQVKRQPHFTLKHLDKKLHLKLLLIDNQEFFFGSHNLSEVGVQLGTEEIMIHGTNPELVQEFKQQYQPTDLH